MWIFFEIVNKINVNEKNELNTWIGSLFVYVYD